MENEKSIVKDETTLIKNKILILGAGNLLRKDDGIGSYVVQELEKLNLPEGVKAVDVGTKGLALVDMMREAAKILFVDAVEMGKKAGTVKVFSRKEILIDTDKREVSLHEAGLAQLICLASILGISPELTVVGIQPKDIGWGTDLSPELKKAVPAILDCVLSETNFREGKD